MLTIKLRNLGQYGIITDVDPYDLPPQAFSFGNNVRFRNNRVTRSPVFRSARALSVADPRFVFATNPSSGLDLTFVCYLNGRVYKTTPTTETNYSIADYVDAPAEAPWSGVHLADIVYINRLDRVPWFFDPTTTAFQPLTNWTGTWRAGLLRACGNALVALNVTKGAVNYPTMVKTSSFPLSGAVPASWDHTNPATNATENILAELEGPIIDAQSFGSNLVIYGHNQAWLMQKVSSFEIFDYFKLPFQKGAINANCVLELDGKHYVFGPNDIWVHDGTSEKSICEGKVRDFIYSSINLSKSSKCFVTHNPVLKEISFCYVSGDRGVNFLNATGCNRAAVYNYINDTWTFDDLPSVYSGSFANLATTQTYATVNTQYDVGGGSYLDQEDSYKRTPVYVGDTVAEYNLTATLYAHDLYGEGSTVLFSVDTNATKGIYLERNGIDLDDIQDINLPDYKLISSIFALGRLDPNASVPLYVQFGSSDTYGEPATFDVDPQAYDGKRLDFNISGRYLSMKTTFNDYKTFSLSGLDVVIAKNGSR